MCKFFVLYSSFLIIEKTGIVSRSLNYAIGYGVDRTAVKTLKEAKKHFTIMDGCHLERYSTKSNIKDHTHSDDIIYSRKNKSTPKSKKSLKVTNQKKICDKVNPLKESKNQENSKHFFNSFLKYVDSIKDNFNSIDNLFKEYKIEMSNQKLASKFSNIKKNTEDQLNSLCQDVISVKQEKQKSKGSVLDDPKLISETNSDLESETEKLPKKKRKRKSNSHQQQHTEPKPSPHPDDNSLFLLSNDDDLFDELTRKFMKTDDELCDYKTKVELDKPMIKPLNLGASEMSQLHFDADGFLVVYTDGACTSNGYATAQAGIGVWFAEFHPLNVSEPVQGIPTNNNAEIQAATKAIFIALDMGVRRVRIYTDSKFLIDCMTKYIRKWRNNNWQLASGGNVKNKQELIELDNAVAQMDAVDWQYVKGHGGIFGNEMADRLAQQGAKQYIITEPYQRR